MQGSKIGYIKMLYFFSIILHYVHFEYVCNIAAKYQKDTLKALGVVDLIKYALLAIIRYVQGSKNWLCSI